MKRNEFKLLMEDWKRNFVEEDDLQLTLKILSENNNNEVLTEINKAQLKQAAAVLGLSVAALAAKLNMPTQSTHHNVDNRAAITQSNDSYPAGVGSFLSVDYESAEVSDDYKELLQDKDVKKVQDDFKKDLESQEFSGENAYQDSQNWFKNNSDEYAEDIADEVEKDVGKDGIPGAEDLGQDDAHGELKHQGKKSLFNIFNKYLGYSKKAPK